MIIDVRTEEEFNDGHVEGAVNISLGSISSASIPADFEERVEVYCETGARALNAKEILEKRGFTNVDLYNDGVFQG